MKTILAMAILATLSISTAAMAEADYSSESCSTKVAPAGETAIVVGACSEFVHDNVDGYIVESSLDQKGHQKGQ